MIGGWESSSLACKCFSAAPLLPIKTVLTYCNRKSRKGVLTIELEKGKVHSLIEYVIIL